MAPNNRLFISTTARLNTLVFRMTGGALGSRFGRAQVLLLTTTGRKSGRPRTTPLIYIEDGPNIAVVASNGGDDRDPLWWRNLQADPRATVRTKRETHRVRAAQATAEKQARLWPLLTRAYPNFDVYTTRTAREIPVVVLSPDDGAAGG
jgi:deazaflavin-dependent oxidoreductase (nitroreductase family)